MPVHKRQIPDRETLPRYDVKSGQRTILLPQPGTVKVKERTAGGVFHTVTKPKTLRCYVSAQEAARAVGSQANVITSWIYTGRLDAPAICCRMTGGWGYAIPVDAVHKLARERLGLTEPPHNNGITLTE